MHTRERGYGITMLAAGVVSCLSVHSAIAQPVFEPLQYATGAELHRHLPDYARTATSTCSQVIGTPT